MWTGSSSSGHPRNDGNHRHADDRDVHGDDEGERLPQVVEDPAAEPHRGDDRGEVVVEQDQRRGLARDVGAATAHGDADVGGLERRRVVDAVASHRDHFAAGLERGHDAQFVLRHGAAEDVDFADARREFRFVHLRQLGAR